MISPHHPDQDGVLRPVVPEVCPYQEGDACHVAIHHWRDRKTGPGHPLGVARCSIHEQAFTLYPPGWTPYGRQRLAPARHDGEAIGPKPLDRWDSTMFRAARAAAEGSAWPREGAYDATPRWGTQGRHLLRLSMLVGVDRPDDIDHVHALAQVLAVPTQVILDAGRGLAGTGLRGRYEATGRTVMAVVEALPAHRAALWPLVRIGHNLGLWGGPFRVGGTGGRRLRRLAVIRSNDFDP